MRMACKRLFLTELGSFFAMKRDYILYFVSSATISCVFEMRKTTARAANHR